ncbi:MAG: hypothetical protein EOM45_10840 [Clostridia bacterium]|nr:hypothetical protein [Clostridia bacterium]
MGSSLRSGGEALRSFFWGKLSEVLEGSFKKLKSRDGNILKSLLFLWGVFRAFKSFLIHDDTSPDLGR